MLGTELEVVDAAPDADGIATAAGRTAPMTGRTCLPVGLVVKGFLDS